MSWEGKNKFKPKLSFPHRYNYLCKDAFHLRALVPSSEWGANEAMEALRRALCHHAAPWGAHSQHAWPLGRGLFAWKGTRREWWPGPASKALMCHGSLLSRRVVSRAKFSFVVAVQVGPTGGSQVVPLPEDVVGAPYLGSPGKSSWQQVSSSWALPWLKPRHFFTLKEIHVFFVCSFGFFFVLFCFLFSFTFFWNLKHVKVQCWTSIPCLLAQCVLCYIATSAWHRDGSQWPHLCNYCTFKNWFWFLTT